MTLDHLTKDNARPNKTPLLRFARASLVAFCICTGCGVSDGPSLNLGQSDSGSSGGGVHLKRIYYTTNTPPSGDLTNGQATGVLGADAYCQSDPKRIALGIGTAKALLVDYFNRRACSTIGCTGGSSENVDWVLAAHETYVTEDGSTVVGTTNASGIFSFPLMNEFGSSSAISAWTGLEPFWNTNTDTCQQWTATASAGMTGRVGRTDTTSITGFGVFCMSNQPALLCVEQ